MKQRRELKKPSDYPLFSFRLNTKKQKDQLLKKVEKARTSANSSLASGAKKYSKSELIKTALEEGLQLIIEKKIGLPE